MLLLNPSVGRRFSVPRSVADGVGEVGVLVLLLYSHVTLCSLYESKHADMYYRVEKGQSLHSSIHPSVLVRVCVRTSRDKRGGISRMYCRSSRQHRQATPVSSSHASCLAPS